MASHRAHYITRQNYTVEYMGQVLDLSFCTMQSSSIGSSTYNFLVVNTLLMDSVEITLGALMCLLVVIRFIKESLQMYNETKRFQLNRYINLLVREGTIYFLVYAHVSSFLLHAT